jgi:hypothetical protein
MAGQYSRFSCSIATMLQYPPLRNPPALVCTDRATLSNVVHSRVCFVRHITSCCLAMGEVAFGKRRYEPRSPLRFAPPLAFRFRGACGPCDLSPLTPHVEVDRA